MAKKASYEGVTMIRNNLEDLLARMLALKRDGQDAKNSSQLRELVTEASVMFVDLRRENREILQEEDRIKLETEAAKAPIDHTTLQLHNLLYEKNYYVKAIKACKDFKSKYPDIDLVPEEEFFQDAPQDLQSDPALHDDPHKLTLQRLNFELHQRKELLKQREGLEARKKVLQETIATRRKFLVGLVSQLKTLKKATLPVQQQLGILHTKRSKQNYLAELLPPPLYILYTQLQSHKEAFGEAIELDIIGSGKDALTLAKHLAMKEAGKRSGGSDEGKRDEELPEEDDDSQRRRKRSKKSHDKEVLDGENVYQSHPLAVIVQVNDEKQKGSKLLTLRIEFLIKLNVLCVGEEGTLPGGVSPALSLANLFPDDNGLDLPNQTTKLQAGPGFEFDSKRLLRPYKWIQHLGGKDSLPDSPPLEQNRDGHGTLATYRQQYRVHNVLQQLRLRRRAQLALKDQLDLYAAVKSVPSLLWTVHNPKATLRTWTQVDLTSGKADEELPSAETEARAGGAHHQGQKLSALGALDESNSPAGSEALVTEEDVPPANGQRQTMVDSQSEEEMREATEHSEEDHAILPSTGNTALDKIGLRTFSALIRKENGPTGKHMELEAKVSIIVDYPTSPPLFRIRLISGVANGRSLPSTSDVLVVSEDSVTMAPSTGNDLQSIEAEVNTSIPQRLPLRDILCFTQRF